MSAFSRLLKVHGENLKLMGKCNSAANCLEISANSKTHLYLSMNVLWLYTQNKFTVN